MNQTLDITIEAADLKGNAEKTENIFLLSDTIITICV
jgi:hypothetical protein